MKLLLDEKEIVFYVVVAVVVVVIVVVVVFQPTGLIQYKTATPDNFMSRT